MHRLYSMFPSGAPGFALVLLRVSLALQFLYASSCCNVMQGSALGATSVFHWMTILPACLFVLLCVGVFTPLIASVYAVIAGMYALIHGLPLPAIAASNALILALLGPGAYSLDARLFGRRLIVISGKR